MKTLTMFQLKTITKKQLREMTEPAMVMAHSDEGETAAVAMLVPYRLYIQWQQLRLEHRDMAKDAGCRVPEVLP